MNLNSGIIGVILLFSFLKSNGQMLMDRCDDFIFIEHIPTSKEFIRKSLFIGKFHMEIN